MAAGLSEQKLTSGYGPIMALVRQAVAQGRHM